MGDQTHIEWTDATWNPVTGCTKVSAGCKHCYAERMARRLQAMGTARYANGFAVTWHPDVLHQPLTWKRPRRIFVNSMSDLFHPAVPEAFIGEVLGIMHQTPHHTYQVLTKRPERLAALAERLPLPPNVWMGTSVESQAVLGRVAWLKRVPSAVRFLSCEPLLGPLGALELDGIAWVIVGGESGPQARPMDEAWVRSLRDQCVDAAVPFFYKQRITRGRKEPLPRLDGRQWIEMPPE